MPKHYDVHLTKIIHVVVPDATPEPEWTAIEEAGHQFWDHVRNLGGFAPLEPDFWATDKQDVYPVDPCDCEEEAHP